MFLGMGTVFAFLIIMIMFMYLMSHRFFPEPHPSAETNASGAKQDNKKIVAAITAAITHFRQG